MSCYFGLVELVLGLLNMQVSLKRACYINWLWVLTVRLSIVLSSMLLTDVSVSLLVIYNYDGHSHYNLQLSVGDTVQIKERFTGNSVSHFVCQFSIADK